MEEGGLVARWPGVRLAEPPPLVLNPSRSPEHTKLPLIDFQTVDCPFKRLSHRCEPRSRRSEGRGRLERWSASKKKAPLYEILCSPLPQILHYDRKFSSPRDLEFAERRRKF